METAVKHRLLEALKKAPITPLSPQGSSRTFRYHTDKTPLQQNPSTKKTKPISPPPTSAEKKKRKKIHQTLKPKPRKEENQKTSMPSPPDLDEKASSQHDPPEEKAPSTTAAGHSPSESAEMSNLKSTIVSTGPPNPARENSPCIHTPTHPSIHPHLPKPTEKPAHRSNSRRETHN